LEFFSWFSDFSGRAPIIFPLSLLGNQKILIEDISMILFQLVADKESLGKKKFNSIKKAPKLNYFAFPNAQQFPLLFHLPFKLLILFSNYKSQKAHKLQLLIK